MSANGQPSQPKPRRWEEHYQPDIDPNIGVVGVDRSAPQQAMLELEAMLFRMGGGAVVAADRVEHPDGSFETVGLRIQYESYMPARKAQPGEFEEAPPAPAAATAPPPAPPPPPSPVVSPEPAQPGPQEQGPPPVSAAAGTEAELEPAAD